MEEFVTRPVDTTAEAPAVVEVRFMRNIERMTDAEIMPVMRDWLDSCPIACVNWPEYPYAPKVSFRVAHSDESMAVMFEVEEEHVRAVITDDNGPVWEDSCVEFFVADPAGDGYFNFETNCIGTALAAHRYSRNDASHFDAGRLARVRRITSLPHATIDSCGKSRWWLVEVIPFELLGRRSAPRRLRANFYKCGDKCERPHFLSWAPIRTPQPDFHRPEFFGEMVLL